jgi:hypothetical protein
MKSIHFILFSFFILASCGDNQRSESIKEEPAPADSLTIITALQIEPQLAATDSLQLLFYNNPDGDSLRYTRYFKFVNTTDGELLKDVFDAVNQPVEQWNELKNCRSEGKIFLYGKNDPLKTVYFSTRCDSCCYLYFIKDGTFFYFPLPVKLRSELTRRKSSLQKTGE